MQPWLEGQQFTVDEQFADKIICPGFIDPHLHPSMAAVLLPMEFITAMRWKLPWGDVEPVTDPAAFDARMARWTKPAFSKSVISDPSSFGTAPFTSCI